MGKGNAPSAPDPYQVAQAQYLYGTGTANYNAGLNAIDQVTPYGSTTWSENPAGVPTTGSPSSASYSYNPGSAQGNLASGVPTATPRAQTLGSGQVSLPATPGATAPTSNPGGGQESLSQQAQNAEGGAATGE